MLDLREIFKDDPIFTIIEVVRPAPGVLKAIEKAVIDLGFRQFAFSKRSEAVTQYAYCTAEEYDRRGLRFIESCRNSLGSPLTTLGHLAS